MSTKNPMEECPPDELLTGFTINAAQDPDGTWSIHCPQWNFHGQTKNATRLIACLVAEIESSNAECEGYPPVHKDFNAWAKKNGLAELRKEAWPKAPPVLKNAKRRLGAPPDDGTRTPRVSLWQAHT